MNSKKSDYILAGIDFSLAAFNIYWGISHDNPISLVLAAFLLVCGITFMRKEED